jgi:hypothetical protein
MCICGDQEHQMTTSKATTQQPQLQMFGFHLSQPPYLCILESSVLDIDS